MKHLIAITSVLFLGFMTSTLKAQDLMDLLDDENEATEYAYATFKTTRIINGHSVMNPPKGELLFIISHRFGTLNNGMYELFGLDQAYMRIGLEYGITDGLAVGWGRSVYQKTYDGFLKYKILRQSSGGKNMPVSMSWFSSIAVNTLKWDYPERDNLFSSRLTYVHQVLLARKFSNAFSLQLMPALVHRNLVGSNEEANDVFAIGTGGRLKLTQRLSVNAEYYYVLPDQLDEQYYNSLAVGVDIETGGHVFQLHLTNSQGMFEKAFITETSGSWKNGGIHFGFNVTRIFTLKR